MVIGPDTRPNQQVKAPADRFMRGLNQVPAAHIAPIPQTQSDASNQLLRKSRRRAARLAALCYVAAVVSLFVYVGIAALWLFLALLWLISLL